MGRSAVVRRHKGDPSYPSGDRISKWLPHVLRAAPIRAGQSEVITPQAVWQPGLLIAHHIDTCSCFTSRCLKTSLFFFTLKPWVKLLWQAPSLLCCFSLSSRQRFSRVSCSASNNWPPVVNIACSQFSQVMRANSAGGVRFGPLV